MDEYPQRCDDFGYWDTDSRSHSDSLNHMNRALARRIGDIRPGMRILDAGSGVGGSAIWLARHFDVEVVGITLIASQVAHARRFVERAAVADRVIIEQQDYTQTAFAAEGFDVVWAIESVCHARDKQNFLREARRLLRPGGRLGIVDGFRTSRLLPPADEAMLRDWLTDWVIRDLATPDEIVSWTNAAGLFPSGTARPA